MKLNLDSHTVTISCPKCGDQLEEQIGRMKREQHISCPRCGNMTIDPDELREIEDRLGKQLSNQMANFSKSIKIDLKF